MRRMVFCITICITMYTITIADGRNTVSWDRDCGPICTYIALKRLGCPVSLGDCIAQMQRHEEDMVSAADIIRFIQKYKCKAVGIRTHKKGVLQRVAAGSICILHVSGNHFVVVIRANSDEIVIIDPKHAKLGGVRRISWDMLSRQWNGIVICVTRETEKLQSVTGTRTRPGKPDDAKGNRPGQIRIEKSNRCELGHVSEGEQYDVEFIIHNETNETFKVLRIVKSCGCLDAKCVNSDVVAGSDLRVKVRADTSDRLGPFNAEVVLLTTSSDAGMNPIQLKIQAYVTGGIVSVPWSVNFGEVIEGNEYTEYVGFVGGISQPSIETILSSSPYVKAIPAVGRRQCFAGMRATLAATCPIGKLEETITIVFKDGNKKVKRAVLVHASIAPRVRAEPPQIAFADQRDIVALLSIVGANPFEVANIEYPEYISINKEQEDNSDVYRYHVSVNASCPKGIYTGTIIFFTKNGDTVSVPYVGKRNW